MNSSIEWQLETDPNEKCLYISLFTVTPSPGKKWPEKILFKKKRIRIWELYFAYPSILQWIINRQRSKMMFDFKRLYRSWHFLDEACKTMSGKGTEFYMTERNSKKKT